MPKAIEIPAAKRYTREDVETALALVGEINATPKGALKSSARSLTVRDVDAAAVLASCARIVHNVAENDCNGYRRESDEIADGRREARAIAKAQAVLSQAFPDSGITLRTGGDPRGACFFLMLPRTKRHNTWGGEESGWAVT